MEDNRPDHIDKLFKDGLKPLRQKPSKTVWENIEAQLDRDDRGILIIRLRLSLLIAAGFLVLFGAVKLYFHPSARNILATRHTPLSGSGKKNGSNGSQSSAGSGAKKPKEPLPRGTNDPKGESAGSVNTQSSLPVENSRIALNLQAVDSGAPPSAIDPTQQLLMDQLARNKKASPPV
ncbi:MAG TPA: hypothetical protein VNW04_02215, partial [Puia sp.]|nr:hypothetical protein [Puia sp.]